MPRPIEKREDIERGLVEVVARKGLAATAIKDIAYASGTSPGLLYRYWRNRDDLAADVYSRHYAEIRGRVAAQVARHVDAWEQLAAGVRTFYAYVDAEPMRLKFLLLSQHELSQQVPPEHGARALLERLYHHGVSQGVMRGTPDAALTVELILGLILQPTIGRLYGTLAGPMVAHLDGVMAALRGAVGR